MTPPAPARPRRSSGARAGQRLFGARALASLSAIVAFSLAHPAAAQEREDEERPSKPARALPPQDLPPPSTRLNLALTGVGVTAGFYGAALASSFIWQNGEWAPYVRIPIAGPWMAMSHFKCGHGEPNCGTALEIVRGVLAGLDGVGQIGGLAIALESFFLPVQKSNQARLGDKPHAWVRPVPILSGDTIGLGVVGAL